MAKPPITVKCECGESRQLQYGERWRCERCGRSWNTQQIPAEEYEGLLRRVRRHKLEAFAMAAVLAGVLVSLVAFGGTGYLLVVAPLMAVWLFVLLPFWRRRYRRTAHGAPRWELHPE